MAPELYYHLNKLQQFGLDLVRERRSVLMDGKVNDDEKSLVDILLEAYDDESGTMLSDVEVRLLPSSTSKSDFRLLDQG